MVLKLDRMDELKGVMVLFGMSLVAIGVNPVTAQPSSPQEVLGEVTDTQGNELENITIRLTSQGRVVASGSTDDDGKYSLKVTSREVGDTFDVSVNGDVKQTLEFTQFASKEVDIEIQKQEQDQNVEENTNRDSEESSSGGGGGGGGGAGGSGGGGGGLADTNTEIEEAENEASEAEEEDNTAPEEQNETENEDVSRDVSRNVSENSVEVEKEIENVTRGEEITVSLQEENSEDAQTGSAGATSDSDDGGESTTSESSDGDTGLTSVSFETGSSSDSGGVNVTETDNPTEEVEEEIDQKPEGEVTDYVEVETNLEAANATFSFEVSQSKLQSMNASPSQVVQKRYNGTNWEDLNTTYINQSDTTYNFEAYSPNGFSIFATTIQDNNDTQQNDKPTNEPDKIILLIATIAAILSLATIYLTKRHELLKLANTLR